MSNTVDHPQNFHTLDDNTGSSIMESWEDKQEIMREHDASMHILHPLVPGTRARREILQDLELWKRQALNGAHQGPKRDLKGDAGTQDPDWSARNSPNSLESTAPLCLFFFVY